MVNGINKPPKAVADNIVLGERLAASNRQLTDMQEEHRQLLLEMEQLRQRAAELTQRTNQQQAQEPRIQRSDSNSQQPESNTEVESNSELQHKTPTNQTQEDPAATQVDYEVESATTMANEKEDPEYAKYLQDKLAEIASLKAQFKRVQQMIDTTNLIEKHVATKEEELVTYQEKSKLAQQVESITISQNENVSNIPEAEPSIMLMSATATPTATATSTTTTSNSIETEKEELLGAMMNMFTVFTADLRSQADNLRAERERLRAIKAALLRRKDLSEKNN